MAAPKVLFIMADYGHDPTETAIPFQAFKKAGFEIYFATENGKSPECDAKMLKGVTQKLLGATKPAIEAYESMRSDTSIKNPLSWSSPSFTLAPYNLLFLPGGHEKSVRQVIDSTRVHSLLADYVPATAKPSNKAIGAICHGVMVLSEAMTGEGGKSLLADKTTTALPSVFEGTAFWATRAFLGDYYKTYGARSDNVEVAVKKKLNNPDQFKSSLSPGPFIVEDEKYNYISGRYPADAQLLADSLIKLVKGGVLGKM